MLLKEEPSGQLLIKQLAQSQIPTKPYSNVARKNNTRDQIRLKHQILNKIHQCPQQVDTWIKLIIQAKYGQVHCQGYPNNLFKVIVHAKYQQMEHHMVQQNKIQGIQLALGLTHRKEMREERHIVCPIEETIQFLRNVGSLHLVKSSRLDLLDVYQQQQGLRTSQEMKKKRLYPKLLRLQLRLTRYTKVLIVTPPSPKYW